MNSTECAELVQQSKLLLERVEETAIAEELWFYLLQNLGSPLLGMIIGTFLASGGKKMILFISATMRLITKKIIGAIKGEDYYTKGEIKQLELKLKKLKQKQEDQV